MVEQISPAYDIKSGPDMISQYTMCLWAYSDFTY